MKTLVLRKLYDYIAFIRFELPNLFRVLGAIDDIDSYTRIDNDLKMLMTLIDDCILEREQSIYFGFPNDKAP